uniref:Uncharacterized protein n=1 Tax=Amphilophus citrinellus TaxID=61819 RepID=A0A3Q0S6T1_AMPCI
MSNLEAELQQQKTTQITLAHQHWTTQYCKNNFCLEPKSEKCFQHQKGVQASTGKVYLIKCLVSDRSSVSVCLDPEGNHPARIIRAEKLPDFHSGKKKKKLQHLT